jgi:hypothetical protein
MRRVRAAVLAILLGAALFVSPAANATATSLIIYNSVNSQAGIGVINRGSSTWNWILPVGATANQRGNSDARLDTVGYYIGPGWCARFFKWDLSQANSSWQFLYTVGFGYKRPAFNYNYMYGVEAHPVTPGWGPYGCG